MRKVVLQEFVSLDGQVAGPNDSVDFIPASTRSDPSFGQEQVVLIGTTDTLLLGRVTYWMFAGFWPNVTESAEKEFAEKFSISLAQSLIDQRLVDEYRLVICPIVLGTGRPLVRGKVGPIQMQLVNAKALDCGAGSLIYSQPDAAG